MAEQQLTPTERAEQLQAEYRALVEFGEAGSIAAFVDYLITELTEASALGEARGRAQLQRRIDGWAKAYLALYAARADFHGDLARMLRAQEGMLLALASPAPPASDGSEKT